MKLWFKLLGGLLVLLIIALWALQGPIKRSLLKELSGRYGLQLQAEDVQISLLKGQLELRKLHFALPEEGLEHLEIDVLKLGLDLRALVQKQIKIHDVLLDGGQVKLSALSQGGPGPASPKLSTPQDLDSWLKVPLQKTMGSADAADPGDRQAPKQELSVKSITLKNLAITSPSFPEITIEQFSLGSMEILPQIRAKASPLFLELSLGSEPQSILQFEGQFSFDQQGPKLEGFQGAATDFDLALLNGYALKKGELSGIVNMSFELTGETLQIKAQLQEGAISGHSEQLAKLFAENPKLSATIDIEQIWDSPVIYLQTGPMQWAEPNLDISLQSLMGAYVLKQEEKQVRIQSLKLLSPRVLFERKSKRQELREQVRKKVLEQGIDALKSKTLGQKSAQDVPAKSSDPNGKSLIFDQLSIHDGQFAFINHRIPGSPHISLESIEFQTERLHLDQSQTASPFLMNARFTGTQGSLLAQGQFSPSIKPFNFNYQAQVQNMPISYFRPYYKQKISADVASGVFNLESQGFCQNDQINFKQVMQISNLELQNIDSAPSIFGQNPYDVLSYLQNQQGSVELPFDVVGNIRDPKFRFDELMQKAVFIALNKQFGESIGFLRNNSEKVLGTGTDSVQNIVGGLFGKIAQGGQSETPQQTTPQEQKDPGEEFDALGKLLGKLF